MAIVFYIAALVAVISTVMVITRLNAVHALLYMIVSLLSVAVIFFILGAAFVAALEVIVYAGAIMVLFVFVVMMLNLGPASAEAESRWLNPAGWIGPGVLSAVLIVELVYILMTHARQDITSQAVEPKQVGIALYGPYLLGVELAAMLLMAGIVGAYHLGRYKHVILHRYLEKELP